MQYSRHICGELHAVAAQFLTQHRCAQGDARAWNSRHVCDELHDVAIQLLDLFDHNTHALVLGKEVVSEFDTILFFVISSTVVHASKSDSSTSC